MAVYYTTLSPSQGYGKAGKVVGSGWARETVTATAIVAITTTNMDNANDDIGLFWVPAGCVPVAATMSCTDIDDGTALVIDIGDVDDEDRLIAGATTGQAGGSTNALAYAGHLYMYTAPTEIRAYCKTAAQTPAAGTLKFSLQYFIDPSFSTTALTATT
jgi:hypothetical protein